MKFLVLGATGTVGSHVVRELLGRNQDVRILTRDPGKAAAIASQVEVMEGDLLDPATVRRLWKGVDGGFILNSVSQTEACEGLMAVSSAQDAGIPRLVYLSVHQVDRAPQLPHFGSKLGVEAAIRASGTVWTILRPNNYYQNDYWFRDALLQYGVYPQPFGHAGISRVDVRDIAELAARALVDPGHAGKTYDLVGPRPLTAPETAQLWSAALAKKISYAGDDLEAWEKQSLAYMPAWMVYDFKLMYRHFQQHGLRGSDEDVAILTKALGHTPRSFEAFVEETAHAWTADPAKR